MQPIGKQGTYRYKQSFELELRMVVIQLWHLQRYGKNKTQELQLEQLEQLDLLGRMLILAISETLKFHQLDSIEMYW